MLADHQRRKVSAQTHDDLVRDSQHPLPGQPLSYAHILQGDQPSLDASPVTPGSWGGSGLPWSRFARTSLPRCLSVLSAHNDNTEGLILPRSHPRIRTSVTRPRIERPAS